MKILRLRVRAMVKAKAKNDGEDINPLNEHTKAIRFNQSFRFVYL